MSNETQKNEFSTLVGELFSLLSQRGETVSTAESFTGGRIASEIVKVSGASNFLIEGTVAYCRKIKEERLLVNSETIDNCGIVSAEVAKEMAKGSRRLSGADYAVATTGNAGPSFEKGDAGAVGFIAVTDGECFVVKKLELIGTRKNNIELGAYEALKVLVEFVKNRRGK